MRASGRTGSGMVWAWSRGDGGSIEESGLKERKGVTVYGNQLNQTRSTRERGLLACKMDTAQKHTPMEVRTTFVRDTSVHMYSELCQLDAWMLSRSSLWYPGRQTDSEDQLAG